MLLNETGINWVSKKLADGTIRYSYYAWRGGPRFWVKDHTPEPNPATIEFTKAFNAVKKEAKKPLIIVTMADLIIDFKLTDPPKGYERYYPWIKQKFGTAGLSLFEDKRMRRAIKKWHATMKETPRDADYALTTLVRLLNYAVDDSLIDHHCASEIKRFHTSDRSDVIWENNEIELFCQGTHQTLALSTLVARYSGLRRGDLVSILRSADKGSHLLWRTSKSGKRKEVIIPIVPGFRKVLDTLNTYRDQNGVTAATLIFNSKGQPWTPMGFSASFNKRKKAAGIDKRLHDIRGSAITEFYAADISKQEMADIFGWSVERIDNILRLYVNREKIISATVHRLEKQSKLV